MEFLLEQDKFRENLRKKALEQAKKFSWRRTAEQTFKILEKVARG
jgi:glycosyltransferase involved in cell wall biosynthesis